MAERIEPRFRRLLLAFGELLTIDPAGSCRRVNPIRSRLLQGSKDAVSLRLLLSPDDAKSIDDLLLGGGPIAEQLREKARRFGRRQNDSPESA